MKFESRCTISAPLPRVWALVTDVPQVAACIPGLSDVEQLQGDTYRGTLRLQVGAVRLSLVGNIVWEHCDQETAQARFRAEARASRVAAGLRASVTLSLVGSSPGQTELWLHTDATFLGRLGEFGHALIARKADAVLQEFALNLQRSLEEAIG